MRYLEKLNKVEEKRDDIFVGILHDQVSYMFGECSIKLTSPYHLALSSTGEQPDHLHVHACMPEVGFRENPSGTG